MVTIVRKYGTADTSTISVDTDGGSTRVDETNEQSGKVRIKAIGATTVEATSPPGVGSKGKS